MYKRLRKLRERSEDVTKQIEVLLDTIETAVGDIRVAIGSAEDIKSVGVESEEEVLRGLKVKVSAALDVVLAAIDEILDVFGYEEGEDIVLGDDEVEEFSKEASEEIEGGEVELEEPDEEDIEVEEVEESRINRKQKRQKIISEIIKGLRQALRLDRNKIFMLRDIGIVLFKDGTIDYYAVYRGQDYPEWYWKGWYKKILSFMTNFREDGVEYTLRNIRDILQEWIMEVEEEEKEKEKKESRVRKFRFLKRG